MKKIIKINLFLLVIFFACFSVSAQNSPKISKIEPPNWWANHSINPVRLMVRGENFQNSSVKSVDKNLKVSNIRINSRGDYIFFDVEISKNTKAGKYNFEISNQSGKSTIPFEILPQLNSNVQTITNDDIIYLIMTDRFANGDNSNDKEVDRKNPRAWHGGDFKGITQKIPYLKELGITAIWLTPWYDNTDLITTCDKPWCPMTSYHGYGAIDYYGVENHFGTMNDLREMIETAQKNGIKVIQDQVANHVGFRHPWMEKPPLENWFPPFVQTRFNNSALLSPNSPQSEIDNTLKGWFDFSLPDMNYDEPEVAKYEIQNALWWIGMTGINGIRQDTIQYMPRKFIRDWAVAIQKQYPNYYLVGEVFERDSIHTAFFQGGKTGWDNIDTNLPSVFDFKLWETSQEVFTGKKPARALRDVLKYDGLYPNINNITVLANNHDTDRFMSLQGATKEGAKLHMAFILATRGIPQLYYGEEILMTGGHDPDNRKDFPGGFSGDAVSKSTKEGRTADEEEMFQWTKFLINLRKRNRAMREGKTLDLFYDNDVYVFGRYFEEDKSLRYRENNYVVAGINFSDKLKIINLGQTKFSELDKLEIVVKHENRKINFSDKKQISKDEKGDLILEIPAKSIIIFQQDIINTTEN